MRLSENQINDLIFKLEERKYGHRLNSQELAQRANVSLDYVNRIENQLPIAERDIVETVANTLGIAAHLLDKIAGYEDISSEELAQLEQCILAPGGLEQVSSTCEQLGLRRAA